MCWLFFHLYINLNVEFVKDKNLKKMIFFENVNDSNNCFDCIVNETKNNKLIDNIFTHSHNVLIVLMRFKISCSQMCSKSFLLKLKFCLKNLHNVRTHVIFWINTFFIVFDIISNVFNERFKRDVFKFIVKTLIYWWNNKKMIKC